METSPKAPCYFLSPNCFWCVCVCVCVCSLRQGSRGENSYVTMAGALWFAILREASALTSLTLISFSLFVFCFFFCFFHVIHFHFQIRYDRTPAQYTASRMSRRTAPTAFRFMSLRAVLMQSELGQRQISAHS